jgi:hypothetical protein
MFAGGGDGPRYEDGRFEYVVGTADRRWYAAWGLDPGAIKGRIYCVTNCDEGSWP